MPDAEDHQERSVQGHSEAEVLLAQTVQRVLPEHSERVGPLVRREPWELPVQMVLEPPEGQEHQMLSRSREQFPFSMELPTSSSLALVVLVPRRS